MRKRITTLEMTNSSINEEINLKTETSFRKENITTWRTFFHSGKFIFTIYAFLVTLSFNFLRRNFGYIVPNLLKDLNETKSLVGGLESTLSIGFSLGKIGGGIATDLLSSKKLLIYGLVVCSLCNIGFGSSSNISLFFLFWFINGLMQGAAGWPPIAKMLTSWFTLEERAFAWSVVATSQNFAGGIVAVFGSVVSQYYGWRLTLYICGMCSLFIAALSFLYLEEAPATIKSTELQSENPKTNEKEESSYEIVTKYLFKNTTMWALCFTGLLQCVIRTGIQSWMTLYLIEEKKFTVIEAGACTFWYDIGGLIGSLLGGYISDKYFKGERSFVMLIFMIKLPLWLSILLYSNVVNYVFISFIVLWIGMCIFGPQVLMGVLAAELAHKKTIGSATGMLGSFCGLGSVLAGLPLSYIVQRGWPLFVVSLDLCAIISIAFMTYIWMNRN